MTFVNVSVATSVSRDTRPWHPENVSPRRSSEGVLIVEAGPSGLECALTLANRGYPVRLVEASRELGGRVNLEARLPGLATWARVRDYRVHQLAKLDNAEIYPQSPLAAEDIFNLGVAHVVVATGALWRKDGVGRRNHKPIVGWNQSHVVTPDEMRRVKPSPIPLS
jgi:dimethylamine/trimethylamine dehydrogenase